MRTITLLFSLIAISLQAQLQVLPNYPEGQEFYKGGYMKFYEDAHDFVKNNNIQPCENPDEVDEAFEKLVTMGATPVHQPQNMPWNQRTALFADPDGNIHEIFANIEVEK